MARSTQIDRVRAVLADIKEPDRTWVELHYTQGVSYDDIDVVVHPQSIVHSMTTFTDGTTIAQLSLPDMRLPIGYALAYPERIARHLPWPSEPLRGGTAGAPFLVHR